MPPRLSKRQQRELEELQALQASPPPEPEADQAEESADEVPVKAPSGFAALIGTGIAAAAVADDDDGDDDSEDGHSSAIRSSKSKKKKKKRKAVTASAPTPAAPATPVVQAPTPKPSEPGGLSKKEKKAIKKQKAKAAKDDSDDLDKALAELAMKHPELRQTLPTSTAKTASSAFFSLLAVSLQHLDSEAEMRRFFGSKVVSASKASGSAAAAAARRQHNNVKSNLTRPQGTWWPASYRQGLSNRPLTEEEVQEYQLSHAQGIVAGEKFWTVEYSKKYKGLTKAFIQMVMSGDPNGLFGLLRQFPYHADTLLQLSEVYFHREEHSTAADFIDRALFTYERAFLGSFTLTSGNNRLDFDRVENRPFFLAIHRQVADLQRRGCVRTSFEFARLLYGLDPSTDPHGALLHLDYLAVKAGMSQWLLDVWDAQCNFTEHEWKGRPHMRALPGWAYARALALFVQEQTSDHKKSTQALREAIRSFPEVVPLLADKAEITLPGDIRSHATFRIHPDASGLSQPSEAILHLLSHLYAQRSFSLWKPKQRAQWFTETVSNSSPDLSVKTSVDTSPKTSPSATLFHKLYTDTPTLAYSIYRHVMVLESMSRAGRLFGFLPSHITSARQLACDPLPPPTRLSEYDAQFFLGAEDPFALRVSGRRDNQRLLERMIPDPIFRGQLQDFFVANPQFAQRFPGGIVEFANIAAQMPEDALEDLMVAVVNDAADGHDHEGRMPGQMPGEDLLNDMLEPPAGVHGDAPEDEGLVDLEDEEEDADEEEEEQVAPLPVRLLRNVMNRFWGTPAAEESSDDEGEQVQARLRDDAGVD